MPGMRLKRVLIDVFPIGPSRVEIFLDNLPYIIICAFWFIISRTDPDEKTQFPGLPSRTRGPAALRFPPEGCDAAGLAGGNRSPGRATDRGGAKSARSIGIRRSDRPLPIAVPRLPPRCSFLVECRIFCCAPPTGQCARTRVMTSFP